MALHNEAKYSLRVLDLGNDAQHFDLYKSYPYFVDVLEWLGGVRPYQNIRHGFSDETFRHKVLPKLLEHLRTERLIHRANGRVAPLYDDVALRHMPRDPWIHCEIAASQLDETIKRSLDRKLAPSFQVARTKASPTIIEGWKRRIANIFAEIDEHDDPTGTCFCLNLLSVVGE